MTSINVSIKKLIAILANIDLSADYCNITIADGGKSIIIAAVSKDELKNDNTKDVKSEPPPDLTETM